VYIPDFVGLDAQVRFEKADAKYSGINKLGRFVAIEESTRRARSESSSKSERKATTDRATELRIATNDSISQQLIVR
jgi:hypothetical protein